AGAAIDDDPDWHPTLPKIVFVSHAPNDTHTAAFTSELHLINADGTGLTRLTFNSNPGATSPEEERAPTWHPDGRQILYMCRTKPASGLPPPFQLSLLTMNADITGPDPMVPPRRLTNTGRQYLTPTWSPDGREIVFHRAKSPGVYELWTINADGTGE